VFCLGRMTFCQHVS